MAVPTFRELTEAIVSVHGPGSPEFVWFWSDSHDGRATKAIPAFWAIIRERDPKGTVREVVAAWDERELRDLFRGSLPDAYPHPPSIWLYVVGIGAVVVLIALVIGGLFYFAIWLMSTHFV